MLGTNPSLLAYELNALASHELRTGETAGFDNINRYPDLLATLAEFVDGYQDPRNAADYIDVTQDIAAYWTARLSQNVDNSYFHAASFDAHRIRLITTAGARLAALRNEADREAESAAQLAAPGT